MCRPPVSDTVTIQSERVLVPRGFIGKARPETSGSSGPCPSHDNITKLTRTRRLLGEKNWMRHTGTLSDIFQGRSPPIFVF